jgi:hypothetical protein
MVEDLRDTTDRFDEHPDHLILGVDVGEPAVSRTAEHGEDLMTVTGIGDGSIGTLVQADDAWVPAPDRYTLRNASSNPSTAAARWTVADTCSALTAESAPHPATNVLIPANAPNAKHPTVAAPYTVRMWGWRRAQC